MGGVKQKDVYHTLFKIASHKNAIVAELWEREEGGGIVGRFVLEDSSKIGR